ncbi:2-oxoglutarate dehydrogenase E1 component [Saccharibacillus sp. CPCC 101409]|uniref:2-oxoglutarate dehydrogenase E1 component n=1 Tax=Saccharibacillus sp. CPCC 101409 TaxID=3058041 RepID=UPI0026715538|nr:2-oxoglutarate dehydrogenase E1 component [Saccharibacillus sp. CPCC 101409]MDO3410603.1 2-oxoglutarate dehydrogenase E1 component [Saccharibacillus sp. CPCC 101409]
MTKQFSSTHEPWEKYYGPNLGYVQEQYERYLEDAASVESSYRELFERFGAPPQDRAAQTPQASAGATDSQSLKKAVAASKLVWNIRTYGHLAADIDPIGLDARPEVSFLNPSEVGLTEEDLASLPASLIWEDAPEGVATGLDAIRRLKQVYTGTTAYEFSHVHDEKEREWLNAQAESHGAAGELSDEERKALLERLVQVEQFEEFLHRTFVGQKRFSIEGIDMLVPVMDELVRGFSKRGAEHVLMGMAHRGRLNVLAHVLGKPYGRIFSEFHHAPNKDLMPSEGSMGINFGWTGDVKYHLGEKREIGEQGKTRLTLANNPSHLEYVDPVVEGFARAAQEDRSEPGYPKQNTNNAASILVHGDAAFPGEGVVAETLNFNQLPGYQNGGTVHIIANNRLGFTTESGDSRSTHYASDLAKGYEIPIVHVNADDPEACIAAARMACEYRTTFKKDFLIDLIGYRRYGHNETDDPETTQPLIYKKVREHGTAATIFANKLNKSGLIGENGLSDIRGRITDLFKEEYEQMKNGKESESHPFPFASNIDETPLESVVTAVDYDTLKTINAELLKRPETFNVYPKLERILQRRENTLNEGEKVDWGQAETLAFASILADGTPIRISGQDAERATFAHRNLVLHDAKTGETYCPLHALPQAKASFAIHNSPLSEASVIGFEYGYNVYAPQTMVIWEAQYGDFANAGQVLIDQFVLPGRSKWAQKSSLVLLLPHGYEGQGPEHSSARLERYLQLAGENNCTIVSLTSSAQYFHLLRRQAAMTNREDAKPLIVMSPKSLIRNARVASGADEFTEGGFRATLRQPGLGESPDKVRRVLLCSGKIAVELEDAIAKEADADWSWLHILRVEQLYPFPAREVSEFFGNFKNLEEIQWVQEEPQNMGAWRYIDPNIRAAAPKGIEVVYTGRPERSSPASGYQHVHVFEQQKIIQTALGQNSTKKTQTTLGR